MTNDLKIIMDAALAAGPGCRAETDSYLVQLRDHAGTWVAAYRDGDTWHAELSWFRGESYRDATATAPAAALCLRRVLVLAVYGQVSPSRDVLLRLLRELRTEERADRRRDTVNSIRDLPPEEYTVVACALDWCEHDPVDVAREVVRALVALDSTEALRAALDALGRLG
jgi:hypothetical protein